MNPSEVTLACLKDASAEAERQRVNATKTSQKRAKLDALLNTVTAVTWSGSKVFIDESVGDRGALIAKIRAKGGVNVTSRCLAHTIVTKNPLDPGLRNHIVAALTGQVITTKAAIDNERNVVAVAFEAAIKSKRMLWISDEFANQYPGMTDAVRDCVKRPWQLLDSKAAFEKAVASRTAGPRRTHRVFEAMALVTSAEKRTEARLSAVLLSDQSQGGIVAYSFEYEAMMGMGVW